MRFDSLFLGLFCLMFISNVSAQSVNYQSDISSWVGAEARVELNKDWSIALDAQSRNNLRTGRFDALLLSPSVSWRPKKYIESGLAYRLTSVPYSNSTTNRVRKHRFTADITFRKIENLLFTEKSRLGISLRLRGTTEHQEEERVENTLRLKFKLEYNLPKTKLDLFASTELFYRFQRDLVYTFTEVQSVNAVNKYRVKFGASHPIGDQQSIKLFGMHQWRYPDGTNEFVVGLGYSFDFKLKK